MRETLQAEIDRASREHLYGGSNCFVSDVAAVLGRAKGNLDLGIRNSYLKWSIPFALDPRYKLKFVAFIFNRAFGFGSSGEEYVCRVREEMGRLFASFSKDGGNPNRATEETAGSAHELEQAWDAYCRSEVVTKTELDRYLEDPPVQGARGFDVLSWWKASVSNYPTLARMARAALAIPACRKLSPEQMSLIGNKVRGYSK